jgi:hypothetical protein
MSSSLLKVQNGPAYNSSKKYSSVFFKETHLFLIILCFIAILPSNVWAAPLLSAWVPYGNVNEKSFPVTSHDCRLNASSLTYSGPYLANTNTVNTYAVNGWRRALDTSQYIQFSVTGMINFSSVTFLWFQNSVSSRSMLIRSSADNFSSNLASAYHGSFGSKWITLDISSLGERHGTTTFRLYFYNCSQSIFDRSPGNIVFIDGPGWGGNGLRLYGTVKAPELSATKVNSVGGTIKLGDNWVWSIPMYNTGDAWAYYTSGQTIFRDQLPETSLSYSTPWITGIQNIFNSENIDCSITGSPPELICSASGNTVLIGPYTGRFTVNFVATPSATGLFSNPRSGGLARIDPDNRFVECDENNNNCNDNVQVVAPELSAVKTNNVGGSTEPGKEWTWTTQVQNSGDLAASYKNGELIFRDELPDTGVTYSLVEVNNFTNIINGSFIDCYIDGTSNLLCRANGAEVTIGTSTGSFDITLTAVASVTGTFTNPRQGGSCQVDPNTLHTELDLANNHCSDSVVVSNPDLAVSKTQSPVGTVSFGDSWDWLVHITNGGNTSAVFNHGDTILNDTLPLGITYTGLQIIDIQNVINSANIDCSITGSPSNLSCIANGGEVIIGDSTGQFTVQVTATPTGIGSFQNPRETDGCQVDPLNVIQEGDEISNNLCSNVVTVIGPDLVAVKSNSAVNSSTTAGTPWDWITDVSNSGSEALTFESGELIFIDTMPATDMSYTGAAVSNQSGLSGSGTISCTLGGTDTNIISCSAAGGTVIFAASSTFRVTTTATSTAAGGKINPTGGTCQVDPDNHVDEPDEANNSCSDTVSVSVPNLVASKTNNSGGISQLGNSWDWTTDINNVGSTSLTFQSGETIFTDTMPATDMSYSGAAVSNQTGISGSGSISCVLGGADSNVITCSAFSDTVIFAADSGFRVTTTATPASIGDKTNPTGGTCEADPDNHIIEGDETDNNCSNTVSVKAPELTATKNNDVGGQISLGDSWYWTITLANSGNLPINFTSGQTLLSDLLPDSNISYEAPSIVNPVNINDENLIDCSIVGFDLSCRASGNLTMGADNGSFDVSFKATPTVAASYNNPRSVDTCVADPDDIVIEGNEGNNSCADSVAVALPDITVTKSNNTAGLTIPGTPWNWTIDVSNSGLAPATFSSGDIIFTDTMPTDGMSYSWPVISHTADLSGGGSVDCVLEGSNDNIVTCKALNGDVTFGYSPGFFRVNITATAVTLGDKTNPTSGSCQGDPDNIINEGNESNNSCLSDTVAVSAPDLIVNKSNDTGGTSVLGDSWIWSMAISNSGIVPATFQDGETIFTDTMPSDGMSYVTAVVTEIAGIDGTGSINCSLGGADLNEIICTASGGTVTIDTTPGSFSVSTTATPLSMGAKTNPSNGFCRVDPLGVIIEGSENNNDCNIDSVTVTAPELVVSKSNSVNSLSPLNTPWEWHMAIENVGNEIASFLNGEVIFSDTMPSDGMSYSAPVLSNQSGIGGSGSITCILEGADSNIITCSAINDVTIDAVSGTFRVSTTASASTFGNKLNPTNGNCSVDPNALVAESDESNNDCNLDVVVIAATDLAAMKSNSVGGTTTLGQTWEWYMDISNSGNGPVLFQEDDTIFIDTLPSDGMSYSVPIASNPVGIGGTGVINCVLNSNVITCSASGGTVSMDIIIGAFRISTTATPLTIGDKINPSGGVCQVDPDGIITEQFTENNFCNVDTVTVTVPELVVTKSNSVSGQVGMGISWDWFMDISNSGAGPALFDAGDVIFTDTMPSADISYTAPTISNLTGIGGTGTITCSLTGAENNIINCLASGGSVSIASTSGSFRVSTTATASTIGDKINPSGGSCRVDPDDQVIEGDDNNNDCIPNSVTVVAPDLIAIKSNSVGNSTSLGGSWNWWIDISNSGSSVVFADGDIIFIDTMPTDGVTYIGSAVSNQTGIGGTGSIDCSLGGAENNVITCSALGGTITMDGGTSAFRVSTTATASQKGFKANPSGGTCQVDPNNSVAEGNEINNSCQDTVEVTTANLISVKSNTTGGNGTLGASWNWLIDISNVGDDPVTFLSNETIFFDSMPASGMAYTGTTLSSQSGISGTGTILCALSDIANNELTCSANGGSIIIGAGGSFQVSTTATPGSSGEKINPTDGVCMVDPNNNVGETDNADNSCSDSVTVGAPELTVATSNSTGGATTRDMEWNWYMDISNSGNLMATFEEGESLFIDTLPSDGMSYGMLSVVDEVDITGSGTIDCILGGADSNVITCSAMGGNIILAPTTATFRVSVKATPLTIGTKTTPTDGPCRIDPDNMITEDDETNNDCTPDSVTVTVVSKSSSYTGIPASSVGYDAFIPAIDVSGNAKTTVNILNTGANPTTVISFLWGTWSGTCPATQPGPVAVYCSNLDGEASHILTPSNPAAKSAIIYSVDATENTACTDAMAVTTIADWQTWVSTYYDAAPGEKIATTVTRNKGEEGKSSYIGKPSAMLGSGPPYHYSVFPVQIAYEGKSSSLMIQNSGINCTAVWLDYKNENSCDSVSIQNIAQIGPGESLRIGPGADADLPFPAEILHPLLGTVSISADEPLTIVTDEQNTEAMHTQSGVVQPSTTADTEIYGPLFLRETGNWATRVAVQNHSTDNTATYVTVEFLDKAGNNVTSMSGWVCGNGVTTFTWPASPSCAYDVGAVRIRSEVSDIGIPAAGEPISAVISMENANSTDKISYNGLPASTTQDNTIFLPKLEKLNPGTEIIITDFTFSGTTDITITFHDSAGTSVHSMPLTLSSMVTELSLLEIAELPEGWSGSATLTTPPGSEIGTVVSIAVGKLLLSGQVLTPDAIGLSEVLLPGTPGTPSTDVAGYYETFVNYGWSASILPEKIGYSFQPESKEYLCMISDQTSQDYTGILLTYTISGYLLTPWGTGIEGVTMTGLPGAPVTDANGYYEATVNYGWSGTVTPEKDGYTFEPESLNYTNVTTNLTNQNIVANKDFQWQLFMAAIAVKDWTIPEYCYVVADMDNAGSNNSSLFKYSFQRDTLEFMNRLGVADVEAIVLSLDGKTLYGADNGVFGIINPTPGIPDSFVAVDPTGVGMARGGLGTCFIRDIDGLSFDPTTGILYGSVSFAAGIPWKCNLLIQIDPESGRVVENAFGAGQDYVVIDTASIGLGVADDLAVDSEGNLFGVADSHLILINPWTGAVSKYDRLYEQSGRPVQDMEGLSFHTINTLYGTSGVKFEVEGTENSLYRIDKTTGETVPVTRLDKNFDGYIPSDFEAIDCFPNRK